MSKYLQMSNKCSIFASEFPVVPDASQTIGYRFFLGSAKLAHTKDLPTLLVTVSILETIGFQLTSWYSQILRLPRDMTSMFQNGTNQTMINI